VTRVRRIEPKEKLVFDFTMESLLRTFPPPHTPAQTAALTAMGLEPGKPLLPAYPMESFLKLNQYIASQRWPKLPPEEAHRALGRAFVGGYGESFMGKALVSLAKVVGPHRLLERMNRNFRSANNYTETKLERLAPSTYELWFNYVVLPGFYQGVVETGLELSGAKSPSVTLARLQSRAPTYRIHWIE